MMKGAMHLHSTYSDGQFTLRELRELFLAEGCAFLCMSDHAEYFDEQSIALYCRECESLSDERICIIAGLEYRCDRQMHILGYGATSLAKTTDPQEVIQHISSQRGAISVIAHPKDEFFSWIGDFRNLPRGIETWNSKYDGRYAPRPATFALLQTLRQRNPAMLAFYGQDLHWKKQFHNLFVELDCNSGLPQTILAAIDSGKYIGSKGSWQLPSNGILPPDLLARFGRMQARSSSMWRVVKNTKNLLDRFGIPVPASLKASLRRVF
jgi:hypothetical protein